MSLIQEHRKEYRCWNTIKNACTNKNHKKYGLYGCKGLTWAKEWDDFQTFFTDMGPMPPKCDGLVLHDKCKGYQKLNCKWGKVPRGPEPGKAHEGKGRRKVIEKPIQICFSLNKDHYDYIKKQALMKSSETGEIVTANDMMRDALGVAFPCPTQYDMFGTKKRKQA